MKIPDHDSRDPSAKPMMNLTDPTRCMLCGGPHQQTPEHLACPECEALPETAGSWEAEQAAERARAREVIWREKVPKEYRNTDPAKLLPRAAELLPRVGNWDFRTGKGLTLIGPTGHGKTRLAVRAMRAAFDAGARVQILRAAEMRMELWASFSAASALVKRASAPDVLLFDDIGQGATTEQIDEVTLAILEARTSEGRPTLTTTQFTDARLIQRFQRVETGEAVVRRIGLQFATILNLTPKP